VTAVAVASMGVPGPSDGAAARTTAPQADRSGDARDLANYDARILGGDLRARADARQIRSNGKAVAQLSVHLGPGAVIDIDPLTGTPDQVASRTALTGPSGRSAESVALGYVRGHLAAFGLQPADLATFVKIREYTDLHGITHVFWAQQVAGDRVFGNGLRAHVDRRGRLISVQGAPVAGLGAQARRAPSPRVGRDAAIQKAVADSRLAQPELRPGASAERVWFLAPGGLRPAWMTYTEPGSTAAYEHVIDAATGAVLYRRSTVAFDSSGDAFVHEHYPGASGRSSGGRLHHVNLIKRGFLLRNANFPKGKYATVWPDLNDDNKRQARETTRLPDSRREAYRMRLKAFPTATGELRCSRRYKCTWDPSKAESWRKNMAQDAIQGLYLTSRFANWLARSPFGFDRSSGNFTRKDGDPVNLNAIDGANTDNGFPDGDHVNNANFNTPPDGRRPRMQMYLNYSPYLAASSSDDFLTLAHEFTHGLSNRLVVNSNNRSSLNSYQAGAMGEGCSDFYAFDYVLKRGYTTNTDAPGELSLDLYLAKGAVVTRTQATDCGLGETSPRCVQFLTGDDGGYTYDDVGDGQLGTQVHAAGEAWAQTLFDIRERLGHRVTMAVVTEGMRLSADDPSMLDMRDAILAADEAIYGGAHTSVLWNKFADRGFGFYAGSDGSSDAAPVADFNTPPPPGTPTGRIAGTVTDSEGNPLEGAVVRIAGHSEFSDTTDANGDYKITGVPEGTWPKVVASFPGYEPAFDAVTVTGGQRTDFDPSLRRDWAAASGGATIASFTGPDYTPFGCGPGGAIDLSQGSGWGSETTADGSAGTSPADIEPKEIVIELPEQIAVTEFAVNPAATCGDPGSASTADYEIYVAETPAGPWGSPVADGTFTAEDRGSMVPIPLAAPVPNVGAVRYVMLSPQVPDWSGCPFEYAGCTYMDTTEVAAYDD
jgi:extracellular elastinolytic metalloproteinase